MTGTPTMLRLDPQGVELAESTPDQIVLLLAINALRIAWGSHAGGRLKPIDRVRVSTAAALCGRMLAHGAPASAEIEPRRRLFAARALPPGDRRLMASEVRFVRARRRWQQISAEQDRLEAAGRLGDACAMSARLEAAIDYELDIGQDMRSMVPQGPAGVAVLLRLLLDRSAGLPSGDCDADIDALFACLAVCEALAGSDGASRAERQPMGPKPTGEAPAGDDDPPAAA